MKHLGNLQWGLLAVLLVSHPTWAEEPATHGAFRIDGGVLMGYAGGTGVQVSAIASGIAADFPMSIRLGTGYARVAPGNAADARQLFVNDATGGVPEKDGHIWNFRADFLFPVSLPGLRNATLALGPRHSRFVSTFRFIGGNEEFSVRSNQWGFGGGLECGFPIRVGLDMVLGGGYDYYREATLQGHDTAYDPGGDDVNPRLDYTYADADEAIDQPKHVLRAMIGVRLGLWSSGF